MQKCINACTGIQKCRRAMQKCKNAGMHKCRNPIRATIIKMSRAEIHKYNTAAMHTYLGESKSGVRFHTRFQTRFQTPGFIPIPSNGGYRDIGPVSYPVSYPVSILVSYPVSYPVSYRTVASCRFIIITPKEINSQLSIRFVPDHLHLHAALILLEQTSQLDHVVHERGDLRDLVPVELRAETLHRYPLVERQRVLANTQNVAA
jgi:hypothetical protein